MVLLILIVVVWAPVVAPRLWRLLSVEDRGTPRRRPRRSPSEAPPTGTTYYGQEAMTWSALDERQLTRLLRSSAPEVTDDPGPT